MASNRHSHSNTPLNMLARLTNKKMKPSVARFFSRLQNADFYRESHAAAVAMLPLGQGESWWDVGCGPGLIARLGAERGYEVVAFDADPAMLAAARQHPEADRVVGGYRQGKLAELACAQAGAAVVSAASLLAVLDDKAQALADLLACVRPGGFLLLIETTPQMSLAGAWRYLRHHRRGAGWAYLLLWGWVRGGRSAIPDAAALAAAQPGAQCVEQRMLLGGLLCASLIQRQA